MVQVIRLICVCLLLVLSNPSYIYSQQKIYNFLKYGEREGLPASVIQKMAEDERGVIWMATNKGLISFDGYRFQSFGLQIDDVQFSNDLSAIALDTANHKIWITTYNDGLLCYDRKKPNSKAVSQYHALVGRDKLIKKELYTVCVSRKGIVYFGGQETDLQYYIPQLDTIRSISLSKNSVPETIFDIKEDKEGKIWVGTRYSGVYIYHPEKNEIKHIDLKNNGENGATGLSFVQDQTYLSYYDYNLSSVQQKDVQHLTNLLPIGKNVNYYDNFILDTEYIPQADKLWISHVNKGIYIYDLKTKDVENINWSVIDPHLENPVRINEVLYTKNAIYLGSEAGLYIYSDQFNKINEFYTSDIGYRQIFRFRNELWFLSATHLGRLTNTFRPSANSIPIADLNISQVYVAHGNLYLSSYNKGVFVLNENGQGVSKLPIVGNNYGFDKADCNSVVADIIDNESYLWIGSWNSGLFLYNITTRAIKLFKKAHGLPDEKVITVGRDAKGEIWLGMDGFGLILVKDKLAGRFQLFQYNSKSDNGLKSNTIYDFLLDKNNNFWFGTGNGLARVNYTERNPTFQHIGNTLQSHSNYAKKLAEDELGRIWIQTGDGVELYYPQLQSFLMLKKGDGVYPTTHFQTNNFLLDNRQVFWITNKGIVKGDIELISFLENVAYTPIISGLKINNLDASYKLLHERIVFDSKETSFTFYLSCPQVADQKKIRFAYMLEGIDQKWIITDDYQQAIYTNIPAGNYNLKLRLRDLAGNWSSLTTTIPITVKGQWYNSALFRGVMGSVFFLLILGILLYRIENQKKINKLQLEFNELLKFELKANEKKILDQAEKLDKERKEKIEVDYRKKLYESELKAIRSQMNPHFIFNVLNSIEAYVVENNKSKASSLIHKFANLSRSVLENSQIAMVTIQSEIELLQLYLDLERERFENMFDYKINIADNVDVYKHKIPSMLIQPIVENAIHHGIRHLTERRGLIEIAINSKQDHIYIEVGDNGVGFQEAKSNPLKRKSFGIQGVESRLKMLDREAEHDLSGIFIDKNPDNTHFSTIVTIMFPIL